MKIKKKQYKYIVIIAAFAVAIFLFILGMGSKLKAVDVKQSFENTKEDDKEFQKVSDSKIQLENEEILFVMDTETTHFSVIDKTNGSKWESIADLAPETVGIGEYQSEIIIDYYDADSMLKTMYSQNNSVAFESYEVEASEDAVRVYYDIRSRQHDFFVPSVFTKDVFEKKILEELPSGPRRRMKIYYRLYSAEDKEMLATYPELANQELYIAVEGLEDKDHSEITDYYRDLNYTQEDYQKDIEGLDFVQADLGQQANFLIPIEYRLTENGFTAMVLSNKIEERSEEDRLIRIRLLSAFGSLAEQKNGYLLVPDGSGGLISFMEQAGSNYTQQLYGIDYAIDNQLSLQLTENAVMPVFGMNRTDSGFFAVIEGAAECASVNGKVLGGTNPATNIYASFQTRAYDVTDIAAANSTPFFNLYATQTNDGNPTVRYTLLGTENSSYSSMAKCYQEYLIEQGVLDERLTENNNALYLDYTGYTTREASLMGIPYDKKILLSNLPDVIENIQKLQGDGVTALNVRLKSYSYGGTRNNLVEDFDVDSIVGSMEEIKKLAELLNKEGNILYLDDAIGKIYKDSAFDQFNKLEDGSRRISKMVITRGDYDIVLDDLNKYNNSYYLLSPKYYEGLIENFTSEVKKELGQTEQYGFSWPMFGSSLSGDYNTATTITRGQTRKLAQKAIAKAEGFGSVLTEGGNAYTLPYVDTILNIPMSDSGFVSVTEAVPFYQMVIHGYRNFAGAALNVVTDSETEWLKTIESGASLYYSCMTEDYTLIKDLDFRQQLYPISMDLNYDEILNRYQEYEELFQKLATQTIEEHEIVQKGVHLTTYEDGTVVAVNYNNNPVTLGNTTIEAKSYAVNP